MTLKAELMEIRGIGEAKAEEIIEIVGDNSKVKDHLESAIDYYEAGQDGYAKGYVHRAYEEL